MSVVEPLHQVCTRCKEEKPVEAFGPHPGHKNGRQSRCKDCCAEVKRLTYNSDPGFRHSQRVQNDAVQAALGALARKHPKDYRRLLDLERTKRGLGPSERSRERRA